MTAVRGESRSESALMREVTLHNRWVEDLAYTIRIGRGLLPSILGELGRDHPKRRIFVVTDSNVVAAGHLAALLKQEKVGHYVIDPPGEKSKHIHTVADIVNAMEREAFGRDTLVVALGGGTVGDVAGFAAAIFKRRVPVVHVPTTTVAQADSSIGGKTGVDSDLSKNAFGAFHHPSGIYVDVDTLTTLDDRHYRAGLVESVKHALIADAAYFEFIESHVGEILAREPAVMEVLGEENARIKGSVVEQDPYEKNVRRALNLGHTVGHAVESSSGYDLLHGEAVAIGIVAALHLAEELQLAASNLRLRVAEVLSKLGMPDRIPAGVRDDQLVEAMSRDKKSVGGKPRFVLIEDVGRLHASNGQAAVEVEEEPVRRMLARLR